MVDLGTAVGYLELDASNLQSGFKDALAGFKSFGDSTSTLDTRLKGLGSGMTKVGGLLTAGVTTPLLGAGAASVKFASDMQSAFAKFEGKVGPLTGDMEEYKRVMDDIYKNNYGESWDDVADAMGLVVQQMGEMDPSNLQSTTESALALRDAFGYDVSESIRTVDTLMKNFGITSQEAFDYIVKGQQQGLDFSGEFLDTINEYSVQFQKLGFDIDDMFNILQKGADAGAFNLDKVGDAVKEFSIRVIDGSDTTAQAFNSIGLNADEMAAKFAQGGDAATQAFDQTIQALAEMEDPLAQNAAGVQLFGTMWEDLGPEVIMQLGGITDEAYNAKGAMDSLKDVQYGDFESAIAGLVRTFQSFGAQIGEAMLPYIQQFIDFLQMLMDKFSQLSPGAQQFIVIAGLIAAAIGPVLLIIGQLVTAFTALAPIIGVIGTALGALLSPIGLLVAAIVGLVVIVVTNFESIKNAIMTAFNAIAAFFSSIWATITGVWNSALQGIQSFASNTWNAITSAIQAAFSAISGFFSSFASSFKSAWNSTWNNVKSIASNIWNAIKSAFSTFLNGVVSTLRGIAGALLGAATSAFNAVKNGFTNVWNSIKSWFSNAIKDIPNTIRNIGSALYNAGRNAFNSLWNGLKSIWSSISGWVSDKVSWLINKVAFWRSESGKVGGSYASGLDYVPKDMVVRVHEGEAILTKQENRALKEGTSAPRGGPQNIHITVQVGNKKIGKAVINDINNAIQASGKNVVRV